jgi:hypothetical protein
VKLQPEGVKLQPEGVKLQPEGVKLQPEGVKLQSERCEITVTGMVRVLTAACIFIFDIRCFSYDRKPKRVIFILIFKAISGSSFRPYRDGPNFSQYLPFIIKSSEPKCVQIGVAERTCT